MFAAADAKALLTELHDCEVHDLRYDVSDPRERALVMIVDGPEDSSHSTLNGRPLRITATDVHLFRLTAWGHCLGKEVINVWREGVSPATEVELQRCRDAGLAVPALMMTVSFHSGSWFELVCKDIAIEVV